MVSCVRWQHYPQCHCAKWIQKIYFEYSNYRFLWLCSSVDHNNTYKLFFESHANLAHTYTDKKARLHVTILMQNCYWHTKAIYCEYQYVSLLYTRTHKTRSLSRITTETNVTLLISLLISGSMPYTIFHILRKATRRTYDVHMGRHKKSTPLYQETNSTFSIHSRVDQWHSF